MSLTATIGPSSFTPGTTLTYIENMTVSETSDGRPTATITIYDTNGVLDFQSRQPVTISDTSTGYTFSGVVNDNLKTPEPNGTALVHTVNCVDQSNTVDKRYYAGPEWQNRLAGDIATDLVSNVLSAEGITAAYAIDEDKSLADWQQGTQNGTTAIASPLGGALQLAYAGSAKTKKETVTSDFASGTLTNVTATNNTLTLSSHAATMLQGQCVGYQGVGGAFASVGIWSGSYTIIAGDVLQYTVWIASTSPQIMASIDGICTDGTTIGSFAPDYAHEIRDQNGLWASAAQDLTGYANDQWYFRTIDLGFKMSSPAKTLKSIYLSFAGSAKGQYTAYFYGMQIYNNNSLSVSLPITPSNGTGLNFILGTSLSQQGYTGTTASNVTAYEPLGTRISPGTDLTNVGCFGTSIITYQSTAPTSTLAGTTSSNLPSGNTVIYTSTDGITYQPATSGAAILSLIVGGGASGISLSFKEVLSISGPDPTIAPVLSNVTATVQPTYVNTNTDYIKTIDTQTGFQAGTITNLTAQSNNTLTLPQANSRIWDGVSPKTNNQTLYTNSGGSYAVVNRDLAFTATNGNDVRSRFDFAGTFNQLDMSINVQVPASGANIGLEWATTNYGNGLNSYAYVAYITTTQIKFSKGQNNGNTGGSEVGLVAVSFATALNTGDWHTLRVQWGQTGNVITVFFDGVQYINVTDNTYPSGGTTSYMGARYYNNSGLTPAPQGYVANFGIVAKLGNNVYTSQNLTGFGNVGTVQDSRIFWASNEPSGTGIVAQVSINGGAYANATNGQPIPGLTLGYATSGQHINVKFTFNSTDPTLQCTLYGFTLWVTSAYNSSGNRISVPLSLASVGTAGSTSITWSGVQPLLTTINVDTSLDRTNWTNAGTGAVGTAPVAGLVVPTVPVVDQFTEDSSANYIQTCLTGGTIATWTWNTANSRVTASGGDDALLLYASPTLGDDTDVSCILDVSENGGLAWRWTDQNNFYYVTIHDASSANNPNTMQLFVVSGGTASQIGSNATISFTRNTPHTFRVTMIDVDITITMDGNTIINTGDGTLTSPGFAGFYNDNTGGGSSAHFYLFRLQYYGEDVTSTNISSKIRLTSTDPTQTPVVNGLVMSVHDPDIQNGALIPQTSYSVLSGNRTTCMQIMDDLVKQSNTLGSGGYWWKVVSGKMNFKQHQTTPAPWVLTPTGSTNIDILDTAAPTIDTINDTYRNSQWGTNGYDIIALVPQNFIGNGVTTSFDVGYPVDSIISITLGGVVQTYGLKGVATGVNWYYTQGQTSIVQDVSGTPIKGTAQELTVAYNGQVNIIVNVPNPTEITRVAGLDQTTGIIDEGEDMSGLNKQAMIIGCAGLANEFGRVNKTLTASTMRPGLAIGQLLPVFASPLGVFAGAFLLIDVKMTWHTASSGSGGTIIQKTQYDIKGVSGPQTLSWQRYISRLGVQ